MNKKKWIMLIMVSMTFILAACSATPGQNGEADPTPDVNEINIENLAFDPAEVTVQTGTTVQWVNVDSVPHSVTSDEGLWDSGNINNNGSFSYTFEEAGTYTYHCSIHPDMMGTVIVTE